MRFRCGICEKIYKIDFMHVCLNDLSFQCQNCNNKFSVKKDLSFSSSSRNSTIICENCGTFIPEGERSCTACNFIVSKPHEDLRIDNYLYEHYEVKKNGKIFSKKAGNIPNRSKIMLPACLLLMFFLLLAGAAYLSAKSPQGIRLTQFVREGITLIKPVRHEMQVVIMKSGQTFYINSIKKDKGVLQLATPSGLVIDVKEQDVLQISQATVKK